MVVHQHQITHQFLRDGNNKNMKRLIYIPLLILNQICFGQVRHVLNCSTCGSGSVLDSGFNDFKNRFYNADAVDTFSNKIDVFIIAGQSNAVGRGDSSLSPKVPASQALKYYPPTNNFQAMQDPLVGYGDSSQTGSEWPQFAKTYYSLTGRKSLYILIAIGGTTAAQWANGSPTAITMINSALAVARASYTDSVNLAGVIWQQGEQDGYDSTSAVSYKTSVLSMINSYRIAFSKPALPLYIIELGIDSSGDNAHYDVIRQAQNDLADSNAYCYMINNQAKTFKTLHLMQNAAHYTQAGYNMIGMNAAYNLTKYSGLYATRKDLGLLNSSSALTVNGSTSGYAVFSQPIVTPYYKKVIVYCHSLTGTATYYFPTRFTAAPAIITNDEVPSSVVTSKSINSITLTGSNTIGFIILEGY